MTVRARAPISTRAIERCNVLLMADVCKALRLSPNGVRKLDAILLPALTPGRVRVYDAAVVEIVRVQREINPPKPGRPKSTPVSPTDE